MATEIELPGRVPAYEGEASLYFDGSGVRRCHVAVERAWPHAVWYRLKRHSPWSSAEAAGLAETQQELARRAVLGFGLTRPNRRGK